MKEIPSVLVVDDEVDFLKPLSEAFAPEIKSERYHMEFVKTGLQGLKEARKITKEENSLLIIDLILPDLSGKRLIEILDEEKTAQSQFKGIVISAHETREKLQELKEKYDWIVDYLPKPIDSVYLKNLVNSLCGQPLVKFKYEQLDRETAAFIRQQTGEIKLWMKQTALGAIEAGEKILKIKEKLNHGQFLDWVELELECHYNTVVGLMRAAKVFGPEKERVAQSGLGLSVVYLLSQGNIPPEMREEVIEISESGKALSIGEVKQIQKEYRKKKGIPPSTKARQSSSSATPNQSTTSAIDSTKPLEPTQKDSQKQEIIKVLPKKVESQTREPSQLPNKFWHLDRRHLLYCGYPHDKEFVDKLPAPVDLILAFPPSSDWKKEELLPVPANSVEILQTQFKDYNPILLRPIVHQVMELWTEGKDTIFVSFLPDFDILTLIDFLDCRCFLAEPNLQKCQQLLSRCQQRNIHQPEFLQYIKKFEQLASFI